MRVLFVSDYPHLPDVRGGLQTTTHELCLAIGVAGAEAAVLSGLSADASERNDDSLGYLCMRVASPEQALPLVAAAWNASVIVVQSGRSLAPLMLASLGTGRATAV